MTLVFATNNAHKLEEVQHFLGDAFTLKTLRDIGCTEELPETQSTIEGNSRQKAMYLYENYGVHCFADDSGLEVEALGGEPGVYSAMYAGPQRSHADNNALLISNLTNENNRKAQFKSVITLVLHGEVWAFEGIVKGYITHSPQGEGGFGYDPLFCPEGQDRTFGQMSLTEKNTMNHRTRALAQMLDFLKSRA